MRGYVASSPRLVVGVDDGYFVRGWRRTVLAAVAYHLEALVPFAVSTTSVEVDGSDSTVRLVELVEEVKREGVVELVVTDTIIFAGFNVADVREVYERTRVPVVAVFLYPLDIERVRRAIVHVAGWRRKLELIEEAVAGYQEVVCPRGSLLVYSVGLSVDEAREHVCRLQLYTRVPEPLHAAGVIASAIARKAIGARG